MIGYYTLNETKIINELVVLTFGRSVDYMLICTYSLINQLIRPADAFSDLGESQNLQGFTFFNCDWIQFFLNNILEKGRVRGECSYFHH